MRRAVLLHALCLLLAVSCRHALCTGKKRLLETLSFDIKPSGQITHQTIKLENGVTCVFTYAAVGGTNEVWRRRQTGLGLRANTQRKPVNMNRGQGGPTDDIHDANEWSMSLQKTGKSAYTCKIERPEQASYLYFMSFALSVLEYRVETIEIFDNSGALLQDEDYEVTKDGKSVQHKDGGFQSNLARLLLVAKT